MRSRHRLAHAPWRFVAVVALGLAVWVASIAPDAGRAAVPDAQARPNVVVLMTDDQTLESVRQMPNVQRLLADEGTTFANAFASYPLCCPSRATLVTGQYAHNHGVLSNAAPTGGYSKLDHSSTLPVWLRRGGYYTGHIGKYMNGYGKVADIPPGYDEWYGATDPYLMWGFELNENGQRVTYGPAVEDYQTDVYAKKSADFIRRRAPAAEPFYLTVAPVAPHKEHTDPKEVAQNPRPAPRHSGLFADHALERPPSFDEADVSDKPSFIRGRPALDADAVDRLERRVRDKLETLQAVDEAAARVVEQLSATGELDDTLIVFTSDNGYFDGGEHRLAGSKRLLYEEAARVPLIVRGPGIPAGRVRGQLAANIDLAPTILDLADLDPGRLVDGRSLVGLAEDPARAAGREILLENDESVGIRTGRYAYLEHPGGERELYDLELDPYELESRHDDPRYDAVERELVERLSALRNCAGDDCRSERSPIVAPDPLPHDSDGDGVADPDDACPGQPAPTANGCPAPAPDSDGDGLPDADDACPAEPAGTVNGCPPDADGDGRSDTSDTCPTLAAGSSDGCPTLSRKLTLEYSRSGHAFTGKLSSDEDACVREHRIELVKKTPGRDRRVGADRTNDRGRYRIERARKPGRYRAKGSEQIVPSAGRCPGAVSATLELD